MNPALATSGAHWELHLQNLEIAGANAEKWLNGEECRAARRKYSTSHTDGKSNTFTDIPTHIHGQIQTG